MNSSRASVNDASLPPCSPSDCCTSSALITGERDNYLRARVPRERIATIWAGPTEAARFSREVEAFRDRIAALPPETPRAWRAAKAPESTLQGPILEETGS